MRIDLSGQVLLVTGSTQGVGAQVARLAAGAGAAGVMVVGRDADRGAAVAAELSAATKAQFVAADLAEAEAPARVVAAALAAFGRVDLLVNAAGLTDRGGWDDATPEVWDRLFAVNARAPFFLMKGVIAHLRGRGAPGAVVNILSMNAHCGTPELAVYSATKGALATLTKNAANACLRDRIRVNGINMGWSDTPAEQVMQGETLGGGPDWAARVAATLPLGRMLSAAEVAQLAVYLLSPQAGLMTGALIDLEQSVTGAPALSGAPMRA